MPREVSPRTQRMVSDYERAFVKEWYSQRRVTSSSGGGAAALDRAVPSSSINERAFVMSAGPPASVSMASAARDACDAWVCTMWSASSSSSPRSRESMRTSSISADGGRPCSGLLTSIPRTPAASLGLPCVSSTMTMSVCCAVSSPCLSTTLGTTVKELVSVTEGSPTLEGGRVRTAGPEDSRTRVRKSSSSLIAA